MQNILAKAGMSNSLDKPEPVKCDKCGEDKPQTQVKHPFDGKMRWVHCACPCEIKEMEDFNREQASKARRIKIERLLKLSSAMDDIKSMTFENYQRRVGTEESYKEVRHAIDNFEDREKLGVFIFGETGNGKSHLTAAGGNELINKGYAVIFITEKDLFSRLRATNDFRNEESFQEIMGACLEADLLIWDDFMSSQNLRPDEKDWTFQIINGRERANKPIWITSNITPDEFQSDSIAYKLDDKGRTWWRLMGNMNAVFNRASNYRKEKAIKRAKGLD